MISKKALVVGFVGLVFVVGGASTVLESFGTISGTANVEPALKVSEVLYDPARSNDEGEMLEIYNPSDGDVDLTQFEVSDGEENETLTAVNSSTLNSGEYGVIIEGDYTPDYKDGVKYYRVDDSTIGSGGLPNDGGTLQIWSSSLLLDEISYDGSCDEGDSAHRKSVDSDEFECRATSLGSGDLQ